MKNNWPILNELCKGILFVCNTKKQAWIYKKKSYKNRVYLLLFNFICMIRMIIVRISGKEWWSRQREK